MSSAMSNTNTAGDQVNPNSNPNPNINDTNNTISSILQLQSTSHSISESLTRPSYDQDVILDETIYHVYPKISQKVNFSQIKSKTVEELKTICEVYGVPKGKNKTLTLENLKNLLDYETEDIKLKPEILSYRRNQNRKNLKNLQQEAATQIQKETYQTIQNNRENLQQKEEISKYQAENELLKLQNATLEQTNQRLQRELNLSILQLDLIDKNPVSPTISPSPNLTTSFVVNSSSTPSFTPPLSPTLPQNPLASPNQVVESTPLLSFTPANLEASFTAPVNTIPESFNKNKRKRKQFNITFNRQLLELPLDYDQLHELYHVDKFIIGIHDSAVSDLRITLKSATPPAAVEMANMIGEHARAFNLNPLTGCMHSSRSKQGKEAWNDQVMNQLRKYSLTILRGSISEKTWNSLLSYWRDLKTQQEYKRNRRNVMP